MNNAEKLQDCKKRLTAVLSDHQRLSHEVMFPATQIGLSAARQFMRAADQPSSTFQTALLYRELNKEERGELDDARNSLIDFRNGRSIGCDGITEDDIHVDLLDGICDDIFTLICFAEGMGYDLVGAYNEVCRSNLTKIGPDGKVHKNSIGKVIKPEGFSRPNLLPYIRRTDNA